MKWFVITLQNGEIIHTPAKDIVEAIKQTNAKVTEIKSVSESN